MTIFFVGVVPATEYLKESGLPMTSRGELIVDKVSGSCFACAHMGVVVMP